MHIRTALTALVAAALLLTGCGGGDDPAAEEPDAAVDAGGTSEVAITAGDIYYAVDGERSDEGDLALSASSGEITVALDNEGALEHNVLVEEEGHANVVTADPGSSATGTIELDPGTYTIYCDLAGHREAGMEATLEVQ